MADAQFAMLLSMGYSNYYIERAIKIHKKSKHGTNWKMNILVEIICQIQEKEYQRNRRKHQYSKSANLQENHHNSANSIASETIDFLYMRAVILHQNKHFEECERIVKDVLRKNPEHTQALALYKDLVEQRLKNLSVKHEKKKRNSLINGISNSLRKMKKRKNIVNNFKPKVDNHPCRVEFRRFLRENIKLNEYYENLEGKFVCCKLDDIRILKDFDSEILETQIGLEPLHCKLFMKHVKTFINQIKTFEEWIAEFGDNYDMPVDLLTAVLENNGIITFEALYRRVKCTADFDEMTQNNEHINIKWKKCNISSVVWKEMQSNKQRNQQNWKHHRSKTMEIHDDKNKKRSHAFHWGFTNGNEFGQMKHNHLNVKVNNDEKLNDEQFIAALSPPAKSIEDMFLSLHSDSPVMSNSSNVFKTLKTPELKKGMSINSLNDSSEERNCETNYI